MTAGLTAACTIRKDTGVGEITGIFVVSADVALCQTDQEFSGMSDRYDAPGLDQLGAQFTFPRSSLTAAHWLVRAIKSCASKATSRESA